MPHVTPSDRPGGDPRTDTAFDVPDDVWELLCRASDFLLSPCVCRQARRVHARVLAALPAPCSRVLTLPCLNPLCARTAAVEVEWVRFGWRVSCRALCSRPLLQSGLLPPRFWAAAETFVSFSAEVPAFRVEGALHDAVVRLSVPGGRQVWYVPLGALFPDVVAALKH